LLSLFFALTSFFLSKIAVGGQQTTHMAMILGFLMELPSYLYVDCVACHFAWHIVLLPFCSLSLNRMMRSWGGDQGVFIGQGKKALDFLPTRGVLGSDFFPFNLMKA
jgi:hypothetical protein